MIISKILKDQATPKIDPNASPRRDMENIHGRRTIAGEKVTPESSKSVATAYRAGNIISDDIAKMPFQQMRRVGKKVEQVQPDGRLYNLAYLLEVSPNQWGWTPEQYRKSAILWLLFYGNAYLWKPPVWPPQLLILPADRTMPVFDVEGGLWYHTIFTNGKEDYIPAVEVLQLLINPDSTGFLGRSVIKFAMESVGRQMAAYKTESQLFGQGLNPAAYIQVNASLDAEGRKKYRDSYGEVMEGSENAYRLAVFDNKITKFETISIDPKEAEFLALINAGDADIANFFGVPLHMLNRGKEAYNSNEQKYIEYLQGTLDTYLVAWEQGARIRWLSQAEQGSNYFRFVRESLLRMDANKRAATNEILIRSGQRNPNETREKDDMNGYPEGDRFYMSGNNQPIGPGPDSGSDSGSEGA